MKRFLLLFCTVVLVFSIMIVPAFAFEAISVEVVDCVPVNVPVDLVLNPPSVCDITVICEDFSYTFTDVSLDQMDHFVGELPEYGPVASLGFFPDIDDSALDAFDFSFNFLGTSAADMVPEDHLATLSYGGLDQPNFTIVFSPVGSDEPVTGGSPLSALFDVFGGVGSWIVGQLGTTTSLFWNGQGLTFLGVLSVCALALAVVLLLVFVIVRFLRFRG